MGAGGWADRFEPILEVEDNEYLTGGVQDVRFGHSWTPIGSGTKWMWIPKGCLSLEEGFPARPDEICFLRHTAKKVRVIPNPPPLTKSFARVVSERSMAKWDHQRTMGKRRQEDWMEEDDLLGGDLRQEHDLRRQLQRDNRFQGEGERPGFKGRRTENLGGRVPEFGNRGGDRFGGNRPMNPGRFEIGRNQIQQGGWSQNQSQQGGWNRADRRQGSDNWKEGVRDRGAMIPAEGMKSNTPSEI